MPAGTRNRCATCARPSASCRTTSPRVTSWPSTWPKAGRRARRCRSSRSRCACSPNRRRCITPTGWRCATRARGRGRPNRSVGRRSWREDGATRRCSARSKHNLPAGRPPRGRRGRRWGPKTLRAPFPSRRQIPTIARVRSGNLQTTALRRDAQTGAMSKQLDILALEPFFGGGRRHMLETLIHYSRHRWTLLKLPPRRIERRLTAAAHWFAEQLSRHWVGRVDLLFTSEAMNLADLYRLMPTLLKKPSVVYFHANQLPHPNATSDSPLEMANLNTAAAATEIWFNSLFH